MTLPIPSRCARGTNGRLTSVETAGRTYSFAYNGLGDRVQQSIDGVTSTYALDLSAGLTQVLSDGVNAYLYGLGRIGEHASAGWQYHLEDALGSVRQLADEAGAVVLARAYQPFGSPLDAAGLASTSYGFTGEWTDGTGLLHLRARHYQPQVGRFFQQDPFSGLTEQPSSLHPYIYAFNNPTLYTDPSGQFAFIPLLLVAAAGGFLGGLSYYALQPLLDEDSCWKWDWGEAILWASIGTGIGATIGALIYGGWWIGIKLGIWGPGAATLGGTVAKIVDVTKQEMALLVQNVDLSQAVTYVKESWTSRSATYGQVIQQIVYYLVQGEHVATIHRIFTLDGELVHLDFKDIIIEGIKFIVRSG